MGQGPLASAIDFKRFLGYLPGMTKAKDLVGGLVPLAYSWLRPPQVKMNGIKPTYRVHTYDAAERAYILPCGKNGAKSL